MFRQTRQPAAVTAAAALLQWRAEHMFRQTRRKQRRDRRHRRASMEGGTYVPPNRRNRSRAASRPPRFNGGRNICSAKLEGFARGEYQTAKLQWRAEHMFRQTGAMRCGRSPHCARFNGGRNICSAKLVSAVMNGEWGLVASMEGGTYVPPNVVERAAKPDPMTASMEGGTYVPPNDEVGQAPRLDARRFNGGRNICSAKRADRHTLRRSLPQLQWRAEHMFRQTWDGHGDRRAGRGASMEGGTYVPPNPFVVVGSSPPRTRFNGGRNICSAKPLSVWVTTLTPTLLQWRAEHMFRQTIGQIRLHAVAGGASMEGGTYVPPNL